MSAAFCGPHACAKIDRARTTAGATHAVSAERAWSYSANAIWRIVAPRSRASWKSDGCSCAIDRVSIRAGSTRRPEPDAAENRQLRARVDAVDVGRRLGLGPAAVPRLGQRVGDRAAGRLHARQHGVARAVQNRDDAREPIAGEAVADRAHDRHRAADGGLEAQLPPLPLGELEQRRGRDAQSPACWR